MADNVIQFLPRPRKLRPSELLEQEMIRVARARYQAIFPDDFTAAHDKEDVPAGSDSCLMDQTNYADPPLSIYVARAGYPSQDDTSPCEMNPDNLA